MICLLAPMPENLHSQNNGQTNQLLYADQFNYTSFARFSPDGKMIAFIKIPDTQTPFTVGELWVIPATVTFANSTPSSMEDGMLLAHVDAGHGYAANWSPDGKQIAFLSFVRIQMIKKQINQVMRCSATSTSLRLILER